MSGFQYTRVSANVALGFFEDSFPDPLDLICGQCGKRATFEVGTIAIDPRLAHFPTILKRDNGLESKLSFAGYLRCESCESASNWKYPPETLDLIAESFSKGILLGKRPQGMINASLSLFDGTPMHNFADGEDKLLAKIEE
ncbi:MAG: hypothetical protein KDA80_07360, partial [Planctomycetaceae bacterium]|nr:hypothetical protein [Planctomycetaceae bacterium]